MNEDLKTTDLYRKTHGLTAPGEQKDRHYNWPVDKNNFQFGKTDKKELDGTKNSLCSDFLEAQYPSTKIVKKNLEDFRQATTDMVGIPRFKGTLSGTYADSFTFGKKSLAGVNWNVGKCIHGDPTLKMLEKEPDLSTTFQHRSKLKAIRESKSLDPNRIFGVPSIRADLAHKKDKDKSSISDLTNYGGEKDVYELLYPNIHQVKGFDQEGLKTTKLNKDQVKLAIIF